MSVQKRTVCHVDWRNEMTDEQSGLIERDGKTMKRFELLKGENE